MEHVPPATPAAGDEVYRAEHVMLEAAGPTQRVGTGLMAVIALAYLGVWISILTPPFVSVAVLLQRIDPANAVGSLSLILGVGGLVAIIGNPLFGRLSDRTRLRWGMRRPWMVGGALVACVGMAIIGSSSSVGLALLGYCIAVAGLYAALAGLIALIPDQVPAEQRGLVSGVMGMGLPIGAIGGTFIVQAVSASTVLMFVVPAAITLITSLLLAFVINDRRLDPDRPLPPFRLRELLQTFYVNPRHNPDFAWTWLSRFLFFMGIVFLTNYQPFFLTDRLGISTAEVTGYVFISTLVHYVCVVALSVPSGWISDRVGQRKIFVLLGALLFAAGLAVVGLSTSFALFLVGMVIAGIGEGIYIAVDLALVTDVLPNPSTAAKDLGVFNVANSLPQPLAPAIAPLFLAIPIFTRGEVGGNYTALFIVAALFVFAGALAVRPVKGVR